MQDTSSFFFPIHQCILDEKGDYKELYESKSHLPLKDKSYTPLNITRFHLSFTPYFRFLYHDYLLSKALICQNVGCREFFKLHDSDTFYIFEIVSFYTKSMRIVRLIGQRRELLQQTDQSVGFPSNKSKICRLL
jgi:hypothetical protein